MLGERGRVMTITIKIGPKIAFVEIADRDLRKWIVTLGTLLLAAGDSVFHSSRSASCQSFCDYARELVDTALVEAGVVRESVERG